MITCVFQYACGYCFQSGIFCCPWHGPDLLSMRFAINAQAQLEFHVQSVVFMRQGCPPTAKVTRAVFNDPARSQKLHEGLHRFGGSG